MDRLQSPFERVDVPVTNWMARNGALLLRISAGAVIGATVRRGRAVAESGGLEERRQS